MKWLIMRKVLIIKIMIKIMEKKIMTTNEIITNKFQEYFKNKRINVDNLKEM